jgi:hypothetical protein
MENKMGNFKKWLERLDPFGFEEEEVEQKLTLPDELPHDQFPIEYICDQLKKITLNGKKGFTKFASEVMWGINPGALKVGFGPQYQVYLERKVSSVDGEPVWITKKVLRIDVENYQDAPDSIVDSISQELEKLAQTQTEAPDKNFPEVKMEELVLALADAVQTKKNNFFFYEKSKKIEPFRYVIKLGVSGGGTGAVLKSSDTNRVNAMMIEIAFEKDKGLIRCILYTVQSGEGNRYFVPQASFFDARFSPTQPEKEIVDAVLSGLKMY